MNRFKYLWFLEDQCDIKEFREMIFENESYLEINSDYTDDSIEIRLNRNIYSIKYPKNVWASLEEPVKKSIVDHIAFMSTNYLPLVLDKKGIVYNTRLPMLDCFSFKSMMHDLPSSAVLDGEKTVDYLRRYLNLDFVFADEPIVWSRSFEPEDRAIISFTSGKESLLTLGVCMELGLEPILVNVIEPSNTYEHRHKAEILEAIHKEFGLTCYTVPHDVGLFHDPRHMGGRETSLGWGNQLLYYLILYIPFVIFHKARYVFYGNEFSCDKEVVNAEGFRTNFCYDQSSHWTTQLDTAARLLTGGSTRVGSLVGPLNEIAVMRCLHHGFPELAQHQMSCFCDEPSAAASRWCCNCSKCARNYAFMRALDVDVKGMGFWRDMFGEDYMNLYSVFEGADTYGFDQSGLGREEQELALHLALERSNDEELLRNFSKISRYNDVDRWHGKTSDLLKADYDFYFGIHEYQAMPRELRDKVHKIYSRILGG